MKTILTDRFYAGIGPRKNLPEVVSNKMVQLGQDFAVRGWTLRSGGAYGADSAFERGCDLAQGKKQIFLPYSGYNGHRSTLTKVPKAAYLLIDELWADAKYRASYVRDLFARNVQQILGPNLDSPSELVVCWTKQGKIVGGTGRAIDIANYFYIPVVNLYQNIEAVDFSSF